MIDRDVSFDHIVVGLSDYTPVLGGQQTLLQMQNSLAQSDVRLRQDMASLYKALGGGW